MPDCGNRFFLSATVIDVAIGMEIFVIFQENFNVIAIWAKKALLHMGEAGRDEISIMNKASDYSGFQKTSYFYPIMIR